MTTAALACLTFAAAACAFQATSSAIAMARFRPGRHAPAPRERPPVSIVRPLRGLEPYSRETLASTFLIDYPDYEILFCVASEDDEVTPLVRRLIAAHPGRPARLLTGTDLISQNPKLNNMAKGFHAARFAHVAFVDSNVFMPPDYLDRLAAALAADAGMVSSPPAGLAPDGFWAKLECAFLNGYQARLQYAIDSLGHGFAQGKTLFFRRADLEDGGLERLGHEPAEDAAATKMMRAKGLRIRLTGPFPQLIGPRGALQVWQRQVRWARLRRASFPLLYAPELLAGALPPLVALVAGLCGLGIDAFTPALAFLLLWYMPELLLNRIARWPSSLPAILLRDLLLPAVFVAGLAGRSFEWHGQKMTAEPVHARASLRRRVALRTPRWAKLAFRRSGSP